MIVGPPTYETGTLSRASVGYLRPVDGGWESVEPTSVGPPFPRTRVPWVPLGAKQERPVSCTDHRRVGVDTGHLKGPELSSEVYSYNPHGVPPDWTLAFLQFPKSPVVWTESDTPNPPLWRTER